MKESEKKQNGIKKIYTLLFTTVLCCSSLIALNNTALGSSKTIVSTPTSEGQSYKIFYSQNFTSGVPPTGWTLNQTNTNETWFADYSIPKYPNKKPSATCMRGSEPGLQDEWLITPSFNFSKYTKVMLNFYWYTIWYNTIGHRYIELNISVSVNNGPWKTAWSFDDMSVSANSQWIPWTWQLGDITAVDNLIDLSNYAAGNDSVVFAFEYYSDTAIENGTQLMSIDDIQIYVNSSVPTTCKILKPYDWEFSMQYRYFPAGARFHGSAGGFPAGHRLKYQWTFGDGNTSNTSSFLNNTYAINLYGLCRSYNVTLTVTDLNGTSFAVDTVRVRIFNAPVPKIDLITRHLALGIVTKIDNSGIYDATNVSYTINVTWGPLQIFVKTVANGTIDFIGAGNFTRIRSPMFFSGIGAITVAIRANPINVPGIMKAYSGAKLGPFIVLVEMK
jgi:hypothetical protein